MKFQVGDLFIHPNYQTIGMIVKIEDCGKEHWVITVKWVLTVHNKRIFSEIEKFEYNYLIDCLNLQGNPSRTTWKLISNTKKS